jgi:hypothetical protein
MTRRSHLRWAAGLAAATLLALAAVAGLPGRAAAGRALTVYAVATKAQFTNHADDRARGTGSNPFNIDVKKLPPPPKTKGKGPQAGDEAIFGFRLYSDAAHKHKVGTAVYSCTFNFGNKALCQADFELDSGAMFASGPANFASTSLTLAVSGGSGAYLGARGQVSSAPAGENSHRLTFVLR